MGAEVLRNTFTDVTLAAIFDQLGKCTSGECEIIDLFGFWSLLFDYMHHDKGISVQDEKKLTTFGYSLVSILSPRPRQSILPRYSSLVPPV